MTSTLQQSRNDVTHGSSTSENTRDCSARMIANVDLTPAEPAMTVSGGERGGCCEGNAAELYAVMSNLAVIQTIIGAVPRTTSN